MYYYNLQFLVIKARDLVVTPTASIVMHSSVIRHENRSLLGYSIVGVTLSNP
jgi:hypothetical protein